MDSCLARAERVPAHEQKVANVSLRINAVGQPRPVVPLVAETGDVQQVRCERGGFLEADGVGIHVGSPGMLEGARGPAVLLRLSVEALRVVAAGELVAAIDGV